VVFTALIHKHYAFVYGDYFDNIANGLKAVDWMADEKTLFLRVTGVLGLNCWPFALSRAKSSP